MYNLSTFVSVGKWFVWNRHIQKLAERFPAITDIEIENLVLWHNLSKLQIYYCSIINIYNIACSTLRRTLPEIYGFGKTARTIAFFY